MYFEKVSGQGIKTLVISNQALVLSVRKKNPLSIQIVPCPLCRSLKLRLIYEQKSNQVIRNITTAFVYHISSFRTKYKRKYRFSVRNSMVVHLNRVL